MSVAYGERDLKAINKKARLDLLYKVIKKYLGSRRSIRNISLYPKAGEDKLHDLLNRICWYLPGTTAKITIPTNASIKSLENIEPPASQKNFTKQNANKLNLNFTENAYLKADLLLVHDSKKLRSLQLLPNLKKTEIIDTDYFSETESATWLGVAYEALSSEEKKRILDQSKKNFTNFLTEHKEKKKAYCFVTGPSFDSYKEYSFVEDSVKIICNSIVKNKDFLQHIKKPHLLVCADPVFHFGPSKYAATFREQAVEVVKEYGCYWMVPEYAAPLLLHHYPFLEQKIIGMPQSREFNIPSLNQFYVKQFPNILTFYMIPLASAVANNIYIMGADGRKPDEKYFWTHSKSVQYDDLMQSVFDTHPSFFRDRDYKDYYRKHCEDMEKLLHYGESHGKSYYSLTSSYIPALKKRASEHES